MTTVFYKEQRDINPNSATYNQSKYVRDHTLDHECLNVERDLDIIHVVAFNLLDDKNNRLPSSPTIPEPGTNDRGVFQIWSSEKIDTELNITTTVEFKGSSASFNNSLTDKTRIHKISSINNTEHRTKYDMPFEIKNKYALQDWTNLGYVDDVYGLFNDKGMNDFPKGSETYISEFSGDLILYKGKQIVYSIINTTKKYAYVRPKEDVKPISVIANFISKDICSPTEETNGRIIFDGEKYNDESKKWIRYWVPSSTGIKTVLDETVHCDMIDPCDPNIPCETKITIGGSPYLYKKEFAAKLTKISLESSRFGIKNFTVSVSGISNFDYNQYFTLLDNKTIVVNRDLPMLNDAGAKADYNININFIMV